MKFLKKLASPSVLLAAVLGMVAVDVLANTNFTNAAGNFDGVMAFLDEWTQGTLGKIIALSAMFVGIVAGVMRGSIAAVVTGLAVAIALNYGPSAVSAVFTATLGM